MSAYRSYEPLRFAHQDARDFVAVMRHQQGQLYGEVVAHTLCNGQATRAKIVGGLQWLAGRTRDSSDLAIVFLAGHGITDRKNNYHFLPYDVRSSRLSQTSVRDDTLIEFLQARQRGKCLVFIDTCHAGATAGVSRTKVTNPPEAADVPSRVDVDRFANDLARASGVAVMTSSTGTQNSVEDTRWNNGAFTEALLEGLLGKADYERNRVVTLNELTLYVSARVRVLTGNKQTPMMAGEWIDFPIARVLDVEAPTPSLPSYA